MSSGDNILRVFYLFLFLFFCFGFGFTFYQNLQLSDNY